MNALIHRLLLALWRRLVQPTVQRLDWPVPLDEPEWTVDDRARLVGFLQGATGRKLLQVLRCKEELLKSDACDEAQKRPDHARGRAVGYRQAIASLIILSAPPPPSNEEKTADDTDPGAAALRESHSP